MGRKREERTETENSDEEVERKRTSSNVSKMLRSLVNRIVSSISPDAPQFIAQAVRSMNENSSGVITLNRFVYLIGAVSRMPRERQASSSNGSQVRYLYTQVTTSVDGRPTMYDIFVYENRAKRYDRIREILENAYAAYRDGRSNSSVAFVVGILRSRSDRIDAVNAVNVFTMDEVAEALEEYENPS